MGCDIHISYQRISIQQKRERKLSDILDVEAIEISEEDKWEYITDGPKIDIICKYQFSEELRSYYWFGRMSEVRGYGPRITEIGLPNGVNEDGLGGSTHIVMYI